MRGNAGQVRRSTRSVGRDPGRAPPLGGDGATTIGPRHGHAAPPSGGGVPVPGRPCAMLWTWAARRPPRPLRRRGGGARSASAAIATIAAIEESILFLFPSSRRILPSLLALGLAGSLLAACSSGGSGTPTPSSSGVATTSVATTSVTTTAVPTTVVATTSVTTTALASTTGSTTTK